MAYIVDGNNVMGQTPGWHRDKRQARNDLLLRLARFLKHSRSRVTVVFDGAPDQGFPEGSAYRGVKICYARKGSDADDRIYQIVDVSRDPAGLMVVTSDRHLAFRVHSRGARTLRSGEFRKMLDRTDQEAESSQEAAPPDANNLNDWLEYFGIEPDTDRL